MFIYKYIAIDSVGKRFTGHMYAKSGDLVCVNLKTRKLQVIQVKKAILRTVFFFTNVSSLQLSLWAASISQLLKVGMNITSALDVVAENSPTFLKTITGHIKFSVNQGECFSKACDTYRYILGDLFMSLMDVSEKTGKLADTFDYASKHYSFLHEIKRKVSLAMYYPLLLLALIIPITCYFMVFLVPMFAQMIIECGGQLSFLTAGICALASVLTNHYVKLIMIFCVLCILGLIFKERIYKNIFLCLLKMPIVGTIMHNFYLSIFFHVFGEMIGCGISLIKSLEISSTLVKGKFATELQSVKHKILLGQNLSTAMHGTRFFTEISKRILSVSEQSGDLQKASEQIGMIYEQKLKDSLEKLNHSIQPVFMIMLGCLFFVLIFGGILPLYQTVANGNLA